VRDIADEAGEPLAHEHRRDHGHVGRMVLAGLVGVVDDEGVARLDAAAETPADFGDLRRQRPDMQWLRNALRHHAAVGIEHREGEVLALLDDGGIARAQHVERELTGDLQRGLINDFEIDRVHDNHLCAQGTAEPRLRPAPSPRRGEGWGEGVTTFRICSPSPPPLPAGERESRRAKHRIRAHYEVCSNTNASHATA
jgi:hypothetical protein